MYGLSPATRGTPLAAQCDVSHERFIPGYAGNATKQLKERKLLSVYPRLRGERPPTPITAAAASGLSPATRGTLGMSGIDTLAERFIPGYAGNALIAERLIDWKPVYPRLRGER